MKGKEWIWNPKTKGSGIITCIPQKGKCPNNCPDCFFQSGRSYLSPLDENLPHIPTWDMAKGRVVRMNDGNDSNVDRELVESSVLRYDDYFFNTAIPKNLGSFSGPVVLTVNPGKMTDKGFHKLKYLPKNLMFVRVRTNTWNIDNVVQPCINYYTYKNVPVILTYMAYYTESIPEKEKKKYIWEKRTTNSYWVLEETARIRIIKLWEHNSFVYECGYKGTHSCQKCGNCIREYYNAKERTRGEKIKSLSMPTL